MLGPVFVTFHVLVIVGLVLVSSTGLRLSASSPFALGRHSCEGLAVRAVQHRGRLTSLISLLQWNGHSNTEALTSNCASVCLAFKPNQSPRGGPPTGVGGAARRRAWSGGRRTVSARAAALGPGAVRGASKMAAEFWPELSYRNDWSPKRCPIFVNIFFIFGILGLYTLIFQMKTT